MSYARIEEGFWTDPKIRSLPLEGKMVAAWLFTNPHRHFSGLYYLPIVLIQVEIGLSVGVSEKILNLLEEQGFLKYSKEFQMVWVINMLKHQSGDKSLSSQQVTGIINHLHTLHGCPLINEFVDRYKPLGVKYEGKIDTPINTPMDTKSQSQSQSQSITPLTPQGGNKAKKARAKKPEKTSWPENFGISDRVRRWAAENKFDQLEEHLEAFRMLAAARGYTYVSWDDAFMNCIKNDWGKVRSGGNGRGTSVVQAKANQMDEYMEALEKRETDWLKTQPKEEEDFQF